MRLQTLAVSLLLLTACAAPALSQNKPKPRDNYGTLVQRVKSGDQTVDFRQLRIAYSDSANFTTGPDTEAQKKTMNAELTRKKYAQAIKDADVVLAANFVDMNAHFVEYVAYSELNNLELAAFHKFVLQQLLRSITDSGDGKTPETAYEVIDVEEEYVLLRFMGLGLPASQVYMRKNGHVFDALTFTDPASKQQRTLYFNVDIPAKHGM